jgi:type VI secretion system protein ImpC
MSNTTNPVHGKSDLLTIKPRVYITYDVEMGDAILVKELPFVVGVLGDFSGKPTAPLKPLRERKFTQIDRDNFNQVLDRMTPGLKLRVDNTLMGGGSTLDVQLRFSTFEDFEPVAVALQIEPLRHLLYARAELRDLLFRAESGQASGQPLEEILARNAVLCRLAEGVEVDAVSSLRTMLQALDRMLSRQLAAVMHHTDFQKLEGTWRGLHYLVMNTETGDQLLRILNVSKRELFQDLDRALEFEHSQIFRMLNSAQIGCPDGEPYGALIGDYEFTNHPEDVALLRKMSQVAAKAFCPVLSAASPALLGLQNWSELARPLDLERHVAGVEWANWRSYRESEESRFVVLTVPRALARLPYGATRKPLDAFSFEEVEPASPNPFCWMNVAYVLGARLTDAFARYGWCTAIRGVEGGGKVEGLPADIFKRDDGDPDLECPTEIAIDERRELELSKLGFLPLCHYRKTDYAVFFGGQTTQKPRKYDRPDATENAAIAARLPFVMATSRVVHYLKEMARDRIASFKEPSDLEILLSRWIKNYIGSNLVGRREGRPRYPLEQAEVKMSPIPGKPGSYNIIAFLRPWLQFEELTAALRVVAEVPRIFL